MGSLSDALLLKRYCAGVSKIDKAMRIEAGWNSRHDSQGHVGIPLASADFVDSIPMVSRLLKELGVDLDWLNQNDTDIVRKKMGNMSGLFYVQDASTAVDAQGRKIIAAQDFVGAFGVKTVFGMGISYDEGTMLVVILFTNENLAESATEPFAKMADNFKRLTVPFAQQKKIFS